MNRDGRGTRRHKASDQANSPAAVDTGLEVLSKLLDCGDVEGAAWFMDRIGSGLCRDADQRQFLELATIRERLEELTAREAAAGGPGSLFDKTTRSLSGCGKAWSAPVSSASSFLPGCGRPKLKARADSSVPHRFVNPRGPIAKTSTMSFPFQTRMTTGLFILIPGIAKAELGGQRHSGLCRTWR